MSIACKEVKLVVSSNWGNYSMIGNEKLPRLPTERAQKSLRESRYRAQMKIAGLNGIEMINDEYMPVPLSPANLDCDHGKGNIHRLVDGNYLTADASHMWAIHYTPHMEVTITITFQAETYLTGIRFWNYNNSMDLSFCGVRVIVDFCYFVAYFRLHYL